MVFINEFCNNLGGLEMIDNKIIARRLTVLRGEKSRNEVAKKLNISRSALQMYETGKRIPRDEIKIKISSFYGKSVQEIFFTF